MFASPELIIKQLNIQKGMKVADFGAGSGYFSLLFARLVGQEGRILSVDVLDTALSMIKSKAQLEGVFNIETKRGNLEVFGGSGIQDNFCDLILLANILFQSKKKEDIIKEAFRALKPQGRLALIDWDINKGMGPKDAYPLSKIEAKDLTQKQGFKFLKDLDAGSNHFGMIFEK